MIGYDEHGAGIRQILGSRARQSTLAWSVAGTNGPTQGGPFITSSGKGSAVSESESAGSGSDSAAGLAGLPCREAGGSGSLFGRAASRAEKASETRCVRPVRWWDSASVSDW